jgi:hypothetical protein
VMRRNIDELTDRLSQLRTEVEKLHEREVLSFRFR